MTESDEQIHAAESERQQLLWECHKLIALIGQKPCALKVLRSVRQGLFMYLGYKANRREHTTN